MNEHELVTTILAASDGPHDWDALQMATKRVRQAFLAQGSDTPDNLNGAREIEMGLNPGPTSSHAKSVGLRLRGSHTPLSDIAHALEDSPIPSSVREQIPSLADSQWDAATRMMTMILISLERELERRPT